MKIKINAILIYLLLPILTIMALYYASNLYINLKYKSSPDYYVSPSLTPTPPINKSLTLEDLKKYNGSDSNLPIYMAYEGLVYDVTEGSKFYAKGRPYNFLTGKDSTKEINLVSLGSTIKSKYPAVAVLK